MDRKISILFVIICGIGLLRECSAVPNEELPIGVMLCQSGNCADWGSSALKGSRMAVEEINASGGVLNKQLKLIVEDTEESISGAKAVTAFHNLLRQKVQFIIGPSWAPGALAIAPLATKVKDLIVITPSASSMEFSRSSDFLFNMRPPEEYATKALAKYSFDKGNRRAAIFSSQQPAESTQGKIFEEEFLRLGGVVTIRIEAIPTQMDLRTEALKIIKTKPDVVFFINYNQIDIGLKELSKLGFKGIKLGESLDDLRVASSGGLMEGLIVSKTSEPTNEFKEEFQQRYGEAPGLSAEGGYDAVFSLAQSIRQTGELNIPEIRNKLQAGTYSGAIGKFTFNDFREVLKSPILFKVTNGKLHLLD
jgi:branched-chain amino acid transport system substrate-binding protein